MMNNSGVIDGLKVNFSCKLALVDYLSMLKGRNLMSEHPPATSATAGKRILVIEPSASLCELLAFALKAQGHYVTCVPDASAGLFHLTRPASAPPDLVILALQPNSWPERDLLNMLTFGRLYQRVAVLLLTMPDHVLQLPTYLAARSIARLDKPFKIEQLAQLVAMLPAAYASERSGRHG
jgi:DNA-binding response OmpR family regulator